jgi:hypothetical protein
MKKEIAIDGTKIPARLINKESAEPDMENDVS